MSPMIVVLDACVLFPFWVRDVLLFTSETGLFDIRWSVEILDEMTRNLLKRHTLDLSSATKLQAAMQAAFPQALVVVPEHQISVMTNQVKDRHVSATAVVSGADTIITTNLRDFPPQTLSPWGIKAQHPDTFLVNLYTLYPEDIYRAIVQCAAVRSRSMPTLIEILEKSLPEFAKCLYFHDSNR